MDGQNLTKRWGWEKSKPRKFSAESLQVPEEKEKIPTFFGEECHASFSSSSALPISTWIVVCVDPFVAKFFENSRFVFPRNSTFCRFPVPFMSQSYNTGINFWTIGFVVSAIHVEDTPKVPFLGEHFTALYLFRVINPRILRLLIPEPAGMLFIIVLPQSMH